MKITHDIVTDKSWLRVLNFYSLLILGRCEKNGIVYLFLCTLGCSFIKLPGHKNVDVPYLSQWLHFVT